MFFEREVIKIPKIVLDAYRHQRILRKSYREGKLPEIKGIPSKILLEAWLRSDPNNLDLAKRKGLIGPFTRIYLLVSMYDDWIDNPDGIFRRSRDQIIDNGEINDQVLHHLTRTAEFRDRSFTDLISELVQTVRGLTKDRNGALQLLHNISRLRQDFLEWTASMDLSDEPITLDQALQLRAGLAYRVAYSGTGILELSKSNPNSVIPEDIANWAAAMQVADDVIDFTEDKKEGQTTLVTAALSHFNEWKKISTIEDRIGFVPWIALQRYALESSHFLQSTFDDYLVSIKTDAMQPFKSIASLYLNIGGNLTPLRNFFRSNYTP